MSFWFLIPTFQCTYLFHRIGTRIQEELEQLYVSPHLTRYVSSYFSVALTRHFRTTFLSSPSNENIDKLISVLPALLNEETTEQVILRAFQCMQQYPPPSSTLSTFPSWYWASKTPSDFVVVQRAKTLREQQQQSILTPTIGGHIEDTGSNMTISLPIIADAQCALAVLATTGRIRTYGNISYLKRQKRHWLLQLFGLGCAIIALLILTIGSTNEGWMMASSISSTSNNWKEETSSMLAPLLQREQTPSVNNETSAIELTSQHKIEKLQAAERDVLGEDGTANANSTPLEERALSASGLVIPLPKTHTGDDGEKETLLLSDKRELFLDVVDLAKYGKLRKEGNDLGNNPLVRETKRHGTRNEEKDFQVNHRMQVQNPILFKNGRTGEQVQDRADIGHEPSDGAAHLSNDKIDSQSQNPRKEDINQQAGFQTQQKDQTDSISKDYNVAEQQGYDNKDAAPWNEGREKEDTGFQEEEEIPTSTERAEQNEATLTRQDVTRKPLLLQPSDVGATLRASQEIIDRLNEIQMMLDFEMDTKPSPVPNPMHVYVKRLKKFVAHKRESAIKSLRRKIDKG